MHPPRDWIDDLLANQAELSLAELQLQADEPDAEGGRARRPARPRADGRRPVTVGETLVRFLPDGPEGRPELSGERFA